MAPSRIYAAAAALPLALALVAPPARTAPPRTGIRRHGIDVNVWEYVYNNQDPGVALPAGCDERNPTPAPFEITAEQKAELEREGVVVIPGLLNKEWLAHLREITDWQVEHPHIWASPGVASGLYDYIQRNIWTTNDAFIKFLYHSPVSTALAQLGGAKDSVRVTTDLLMVNPNKGFKWHQDNQNGPVGFDNALRWWVTMDDSPKDYGAPVYLKKSQNNKCVPEDAVFVNIDEGDLPEYHDFTTFRPKAGDLIVWHARTIHKIDGPTSQDWGSMKRRVLGGTVAIDDATYVDKEKVEFADMGRHSLKHGDPLTDPHFPKIWPRPDPAEVVARFNGDVGRSREGFGRMVGAMFSAKTFEQFASWGNVLKKKDQAVEEEEVEQREEVPASR
uniref:Phytanoyl-CoA dioxygenase n=1 Tax=Pelagomonas calceolata TaxID=35677 RepID=A0A7S4EA30_9STRA|mmetsp:Transcript_18185/g.51820  ORF Transcript_18185/g.51820 Transcript_18185/m.51820 type:complete len:389 (+) Transcript_18185:139-1305(+)